ncbi:MAG: hypothetical protein M1831_005022 [Alyxoria varia]|nr:MAG: hypothetical protein M1831_005022 [Alyxoria varia]
MTTTRDSRGPKEAAEADRSTRAITTEDAGYTGDGRFGKPMTLLRPALNNLREITHYVSKSTISNPLRRWSDLPGNPTGKSNPAAKIDAKIYHPKQQVTNAQAPPPVTSLCPTVASPLAICQNAPVRKPKAITSVRNMKQKQMFVRRART